MEYKVTTIPLLKDNKSIRIYRENGKRYILLGIAGELKIGEPVQQKESEAIYDN